MQYNRASRLHGSANAQTIVSRAPARATQPRQEKTALYQHIYVCIYIYFNLPFFSPPPSFLHLCNEQRVGTKPARKSQQDPTWMAKKWLLWLFALFLQLYYPLSLCLVTCLPSTSIRELPIYIFFVFFSPLFNSCHCKTAPKIYQCLCKIHKH